MQRRGWRWLLVGLMLAAVGKPAGAQLRAVSLASATGSTTVRRSASTTYVPATRGMTLAPGDIVRTGPNAGAVILFPDGSSIKLRANSALIIPKADSARPDIPSPLLIA